MTAGAPRIGVLGGTFDPLHHGHLDAADAARRALALAAVVLMPSRVPPHKTSPVPTSGYHRFAMAALASSERERLRVSDLELRSAAPSYTSRTLRQLARAGYAPSQIFFILGSDAFAEITHWHDYPALLSRGHFAVVARAGTSLADLRDRLPELAGRMREPRTGPRRRAPAGSPAVWLVDAETRDVASSTIRRRLAASEPAGDLLPAAVANYVSRHRLYDANRRGELFA